MINFWRRRSSLGYYIVGDYNGVYYAMWLAEMSVFKS